MIKDKLYDHCDVAYSGKYIKHNDKTYMLAPERSQLGCNGCSLVGKSECDKEVAKYCCQGFILKEVNI